MLVESLTALLICIKSCQCGMWINVYYIIPTYITTYVLLLINVSYQQFLKEISSAVNDWTNILKSNKEDLIFNGLSIESKSQT